jgi:hypothetical protein
MSKKKRRKVLFVTLSPTRIELTGFNGLGNWILDGEEHSSNNGHRCIDDS